MAYVPNLQTYSKAGPAPSKGALLTGTGSASAAWLAAGPNADTVVADSTQPDGLRWTIATPIIIDETNGSYQALAPGGSSVSGTSGNIADSHHTHALPSFAGTGVATTFARSDHVHTKSYLIPHTYSVSNLVQVPNGSDGYLPPLFVSTLPAQTVQFYGWSAILRGGTSAAATFTIQRTPVTTGTPGSPVTLVTAGTGSTQGHVTVGSVTGQVPVASPTTLGDQDMLAPVISTVTNVPDGLSITLFLLYTITT